MNQCNNASKRNILKLSILAAMGLLLLIAFPLVGATHAWLFASPVIESSIFEAGTVIISEPELQSRSFNTEPACWEFTNVGSKKAYIRVRLEGSGVKGESAWSDGVTGFQDSYFIFTLGTEESNEITVNFIQNPVRRFKIGEITARNDDDFLYVELDTNFSGGLMQSSKHHITLKPNNNGHAGWSQEYEHSENETLEYTYKIPLDNVQFDDNNETFIAVHSVFDRPTGSSGGELIWNLSGSSDSDWQWVEGLTNDDHGWYYYRGTVERQTVTDNGQTVSICFEAGSAKYDDVKLIAEAVQASHEAVFKLWGMGYLSDLWHRVTYENKQWQISKNGNTYVWKVLNQDGEKGWELIND